MNQKALSAFVLIGIVLFVPLMMYGTVTPCGIAKQQFKSRLLRRIIDPASTGSAGATLGTALSAALGPALIDRWFTSISPFDCIKILIRVNITGLPISGSELGSPGLALSPTGRYVTESRSCKVDHWNWRNASSPRSNFLIVEGIVSPVSIQYVFIQAFDDKDEFLGNAQGIIKPGGSFQVLIDRRNLTGKLNIKYTCR